MRRLCDFLQHRLNGLHIYCFLMELGFSRQRARSLAFSYELFINPVVYGGGHPRG